MQRPNILYLHSHDTGRYIQPYGHDIPTPNMQRLAETGVLFRHAFTAAPTCSPSRACLVTGQCAHVNGMLGLTHRGFKLNDYSHHWVHTFKKTGYTTALIGTQHVATKDNVDDIGYDYIEPMQGARAANVGPAAAQWLQNAPQEPFFLDVGFFETHRVFPEGNEHDAKYSRPPAPLPDTPETRADMAAYKESARLLDEGIGQVLDALEKSGLAENTLVIHTTDHGIAFPNMKCSLTDHGTGVLLVMRGPGGFEGGGVLDGLVSQIDIFPTVCELLEIEPPAWLEGRSILPLVRGETDEINEQIFGEVTYHAAYEPKRNVRTKRWKYIRRFDDYPYPVLPNCDDSPSKDVWLANGWAKQEVPREQLYDLVFDPNETNNLIDDPGYSEPLADLKNRLQKWMEQTNDPLLKGPVPAPSGAQINDQDAPSPKSTPRVVE